MPSLFHISGVLLTVLAGLSCGGGGGGGAAKPAGPTGPVATTPDPSKPATTPPAPAPVAPAVDAPPELFPPIYKKIGVGQTVSFSTSAIDQDLDETRVDVTDLPKSATFDPITQTVVFTPTKADIPKVELKLRVSQPQRGKTLEQTWTIEVDPKPQPLPVAEVQSPMIETVLMIRQGKRLEQINKDWPLDKLLLAGAEGFKWQFPEDKRKLLEGKLDKKALWESFLASLAQTHNNPRLDPKSDKLDPAFADPAAWKIVAVRPRIDRWWTEMRIVYRAVKAPEPVYAMFRIRPVVEYVPALPRKEEERVANNKAFLGMVTKHLMPDGGPSDKLMKDQVAHGKAVAALMNDLMAFDQSKTAEYLRTFVIGIALEARMGGGSSRNPDGSYKSGDGWGWSAMKPFQTADGKSQAYVNVIIPGFWTKTVPIDNNTSWGPACAPKYTAGQPGHVAGYEVLCRKTMGFVDLPDTSGGKVKGGRIDSNQLYIDHKKKDMVASFPLEDGRRDLGEENGMTCSQCHIRNFGMHDYSDKANIDPKAGVPKTLNKQIPTLNFQIVPSSHWEAFTIEFLHHQECRGKERLTEFLSADAAKGLGCPLQPK
jgi:hypothetical protein